MLRLQADARTRVISYLHQSILRAAVKAGDKVLDAGCGPGRFSIALKEIGADFVAADASTVQLALAGQSLAARFPRARHRLAQLNVPNLPFCNAAFDCVVCFGSVLSHLGSDALAGFGELVRVTKRGGALLVSVQSMQNFYLPDLLEWSRQFGVKAVDRFVLEGEEIPNASSIPWRQFSHAEIESTACDLGCRVEMMSASNVLATVESIPLLESIERDERLWRSFLRWEEHLARQPNNLDRGAHLIAALRKL